MSDPLASLSAHEWRWLGAMAVEHGVSRGILRGIGGEQGLATFLAEMTRAAVVVAHGDELFVHPAYEQLVMRALAETNALENIAFATGRLLEARSVADVNVALQSGDLHSFDRHVALRRLPRATALRTPAEWLRRSVCEPFDPRWLVRTFGDDAVRIAERVLRESLRGPAECAALYAWAFDLEHRESLDRVLYEHAVLRDDRNRLAALERPHRRVAALVVRGEVAAAQRVLDEEPDGGPIHALLLVARNERKKAKLQDADLRRAFALMLQCLDKPEVDTRKLVVHATGADAGAWELLFAGFAAHLRLGDAWARAAWAQRLARSAIAWNDLGYLWLAREGAGLAHVMHAEHAARVFAESGAHLTTSQSLFDLVVPKPEWQTALEALAAVSATLSSETGAEGRVLRVAWYLDMSDGGFRKPALQELRPGLGFSAGVRVSIGELWNRRSELPAEDRRILECSREVRGDRELTPEAHEMLVGHPRVFDGARLHEGMPAPVEVVRGACRVETEDEAGHIRIAVEPAGAKLGVNVMVQSPSRVVVFRVTPTMHKVIAALPHGVRIPKTHVGEVTRILGQLADDIEVRSEHLGREENVEPDPTPCVRISSHAGAWLVQVGVRPFGEEGRFFVAAHGREAVVTHAAGKRVRCVRRFHDERRRVDALIEECETLRQGERDREPDAWILDQETLLALLSELRDARTPHALEWPETTPLRIRSRVTTRQLRAQVKRLKGRKGWYLASGTVKLDELNSIDLSQLAYAPAVGNGRFVRLENGDYVEIERRVRAVMNALAATKLELPPSAVEPLRELAEVGFDVSDAEDWLARVEQASRTVPEVPSTLKAELREYQREGFRFLMRLCDLGLGACLADDMGLGKTVQIIALLLARAHEGPALVVAPTSVCSNWARELARFAPTLRVIEYAGKERTVSHASSHTVVICSYALLQQDEPHLTRIRWNVAVLDEAQFIKNAESLRARAAYALQAAHRIAATGTPVENHFGDLWSIFRFLNPGLLGDWPSFRRAFVQPIESGASRSLAKEDQPQTLLRRRVRPYVLRRRKQDVLRELPPRTDLRLDVQLSKEHAVLYGVLRKQIDEKLFGPAARHDKLQVLAEITRLRRFCCHPRLVFPHAEGESAKIDAFLDLASELQENGHRALVFSQWVDFLSLVREQLEERNIEYVYLDGSTPAADRAARVDAFQRGEAPLFLISLKAGGFGLNLTAADYVIHLDPWWNPAVEAQATDRAHRIGQERRVTVYRLVTKDTIEQQIAELHEKKLGLSASLLDGGLDGDDVLDGELEGLLARDEVRSTNTP